MATIDGKITNDLLFLCGTDGGIEGIYSFSNNEVKVRREDGRLYPIKNRQSFFQSDDLVSHVFVLGTQQVTFNKKTYRKKIINKMTGTNTSPTKLFFLKDNMSDSRFMLKCNIQIGSEIKEKILVGSGIRAGYTEKDGPVYYLDVSTLADGQYYINIEDPNKGISMTINNIGGSNISGMSFVKFKEQVQAIGIESTTIGGIQDKYNYATISGSLTFNRPKNPDSVVKDNNKNIQALTKKKEMDKNQIPSTVDSVNMTFKNVWRIADASLREHAPSKTFTGAYIDFVGNNKESIETSKNGGKDFDKSIFYSEQDMKDWLIDNKTLVMNTLTNGDASMGVNNDGTLALKAGGQCIIVDQSGVIISSLVTKSGSHDQHTSVIGVPLSVNTANEILPDNAAPIAAARRFPMMGEIEKVLNLVAHLSSFAVNTGVFVVEFKDQLALFNKYKAAEDLAAEKEKNEKTLADNLESGKWWYENGILVRGDG